MFSKDFSRKAKGKVQEELGKYYKYIGCLRCYYTTYNVLLKNGVEL